jgi:hypothetical protein
MKRIIQAASAAMVLMACGIVVAKEVAPGAVTEAQTIKPQKLCPVTGEGINTNLFVDVQGKRIYVCCAGCISPIKKDPAKFIDKMEKEGVTLDKAPVAEPAKNPTSK